MNALTLEIKAKGYSLAEFVRTLGISLRTYRRYEKVGHSNHEWLIEKIDKLGEPKKNRMIPISEIDDDIKSLMSAVNWGVK